MTAAKYLPPTLFAGPGEDAAASELRRAAWREAVATLAIGLLPIRPTTTVVEAADVVADAIEGGLNALESECPGMLSVGGQALRDRLELLAWRAAGEGGWRRKPSGEARKA